MMGCEHCSHPLWAGIKCSQCGRWYDECRTCGKRGCEECMKAEPSEALKQTWADYQEAIKRFECPRCGHNCCREWCPTLHPPHQMHIVHTGWLCPACGRGNAPINMTCPCKGWPKMEVTC